MNAAAAKRDFVKFVSLLPTLAMFAGFVWFAAVNLGDEIAPKWDMGTTTEIMDIREHAKGSQPWAIEKSGCVQTREGEFPKSVIIAKVGTGWYETKTDEEVGEVFEQLVFDGTIPANEWTSPVDHGIRVGVMCR